jgi:hypothetical protein
MKYTSLIYNEENFAILKEIIKINITQIANPVSYSVDVDNARVIWRTNDPEMFDQVKKFLTKETDKIIVSIYAGKSNFNFKYILENVKGFLV